MSLDGVVKHHKKYTFKMRTAQNYKSHNFILSCIIVICLPITALQNYITEASLCL